MARPSPKSQKPKLDIDTPSQKGPRTLGRQLKVNGATLEYQALHFQSTADDLDLFEEHEWRPRQVILARLRMLEREVSLKTLPVILALIPVAAAVTGLSLATEKSKLAPTGTTSTLAAPAETAPTAFYDQYLFFITIFLALAAIILYLATRHHRHKEACLEAWSEAFSDSHSFKTKCEEEERKAKKDGVASANATVPQPTSEPHSWIRKKFG